MPDEYDFFNNLFSQVPCYLYHTFQLLDFLNRELRTCFYCVGDTVTPEAPHGGAWGAEKFFIFKCSKTPEKHFKNLFLCLFIESRTRLDLFQKHHCHEYIRTGCTPCIKKNCWGKQSWLFSTYCTPKEEGGGECVLNIFCFCSSW